MMTRLTGDASLTAEQDLELLIGIKDEDTFDRARSYFDSEEERRQAWFANRERLIEWSATGHTWGAEHYDREDSR